MSVRIISNDDIARWIVSSFDGEYNDNLEVFATAKPSMEQPNAILLDIAGDDVVGVRFCITVEKIG